MNKVLGYESSHALVERNSTLRWDGWTMVYFQPHRAASTSPKGRYHKGRWGFETRIEVSDQGTWKVPSNVTRFVK